MAKAQTLSLNETSFEMLYEVLLLQEMASKGTPMKHFVFNGKIHYFIPNKFFEEKFNMHQGYVKNSLKELFDSVTNIQNGLSRIQPWTNAVFPDYSYYYHIDQELHAWLHEIHNQGGTEGFRASCRIGEEKKLERIDFEDHLKTLN